MKWKEASSGFDGGKEIKGFLTQKILGDCHKVAEELVIFVKKLLWLHRLGLSGGMCG